MTGRPRVVRGAAIASAGLLLLMAGGCSHYRIGIPLVPGLSLGLGATKDGNFSVGLNTGFGPLGAGVAVNNGGLVSGTAGVGVGVGPVATGVGKGAVLYDPKAAPAVPAGAVASATPVAAVAPVAPAPAAPVRYSTPADPFTPMATGAPAPAALPARAPLVKITRPPPEPPVPAVNVSYRTPGAAAAPARDVGTPGNPVAP
ncbi:MULTISPECIES: hypothetical protein [unclassified Variovorax]|uniref:hypothetical protein n=1 Tax=unclassified Variovorax TaxID=663243 RepID=UPI003F4867ED